MTIGNIPAFPVRNTDEHHFGLTKREYFAAMALTGINLDLFPLKGIEDEAAKTAVKYADALIEQLNKT